MAVTFKTLREDLTSRAAAEEEGRVEMARIWLDYLVPLPPLGAQLVRFHVKPRSDWSQFTAVGFSIPDATPLASSRVLCGDQPLESMPDRAEPISDYPTSAGPDEVSVPEGILGISSLYGLSVQCEAQGWKKLASRIYRRASGNKPAPASFGYQLVWQHLLTEVLKSGSDRSALAGQMRRLLQSGHDLPEGKGTQIHEAIISPHLLGAPSPESIIARMLADRLVSSRILSDAVGHEAPLSDPFYHLEDLGFAAVPVLIEYLEDDRLTGKMTAAMINMQVSRPIQVKDLAAVLLRQVLGDRLHQYGRAFPSTRSSYKELVLAIWEQAKATGEEAWLLEGAPASENKTGIFPNQCHLRLLQARYPERLADVLRFQMEHRPKAVAHPIITAVAQSKLPVARKIALLKEAAAVWDNPDTKDMALTALSRYDSVYFNCEAVKAFDTMPSDTQVDYWHSPEASLSNLALCTNDPHVWAAFLRAAQRAETGLRMELMNSLTRSQIGEKYRTQCLAFLSALLQDTTLRSLDNGAYSGPCAAFTIPRLRVCDFAAMQIARLMGWPDRPDRTWTEGRWDHLRGRAALSSLQ